MREQRFASAHLFGAACPGRGTGVAPVLPEADAATMNLLLAELAGTLPPQAHAVLVLDRAGWPISGDRAVPANLTLLHLPSKSPELKPMEEVWQDVRERWLSHRVRPDDGAILDAACAAWNGRGAEPGRLQSLTCFPWLPASVKTS